ncbi:MAG: Dna2/Cas4 domain-containing protein [Nanoarchaeota archaeon]|nr:Dna2/Cas4 domain-containing protein [Nanoarchaeota archaeon]
MNKITMDENHLYRVNGKIVPGVSELLMEVGLIDANVIKFADTSLGSAVHKAAELSDKGILDYDSCCEEVKSRLKQWRAFISDPKFEIIANEQMFYSKLGYCGTPDRVLKRGEDHILVDIKTSKVRSKSTKVQMAFYQRLVEENLEINIDEGWEVVLLEDKYEIVTHNDLTTENGMMKSILNIHFYKEKK